MSENSLSKSIPQPDMDLIRRQFSFDAFANHVGIHIEEVSPGYSRITLDISDHHLNSLGTTHGAAIFTAADLALAVAANSYGEAAVAQNFSINYIKASGKGNTLTAVATEESRTRKTGLYRIVVTDDKGNKIAVGSSSVYLLGKEIAGELGKGPGH